MFSLRKGYVAASVSASICNPSCVNSPIILRMFEKLAKTDLIIIDNSGMATMDQQLQLDFMEIIEDKHARKAIIIVSQLPVNN